MRLLVAAFENDTCDVLKLGTDAEHALDTALFFGDGEEGKEVDYLVHEFDIRASAGVLGVLGVLEDVGEECDECRDGEVEYQPKII